MLLLLPMVAQNMQEVNGVIFF